MSRRSLAVLCCAVLLLLLVLLLSGVGRKVGGERAKVEESRKSRSFCNDKKKVAAWRGDGLCRSYAAVICQLMLK